MRKPMVAGNWKMNKTVAEGVKLVEELAPMIKDITAVDRVVCPPFTALYSVSEVLKGSGIGCGAILGYMQLLPKNNSFFTL